MHPLDIAIILVYFAGMIIAGSVMSKRASKDLPAYFLGGRSLPWFALGVSNAGGMFDISGTMWLVYLLFLYGMKSVFIPWIWPLFNQVFLMVYLAAWLRRSNALTGAEWITTRFDQGSAGGKLAHLVVVVFSIVSIVGFLAYAFVGIGKFSAIFLPWGWSPHVYAAIVTVATGAYVVRGGMYGVVVTDILQYVLMTASAVVIAVIAMDAVSPEMISAATPHGWGSLAPDWRLSLDWSGIIASANARIASDGYQLFIPFLMMAAFKGVFVSLAGPVATQALQKVLAARTPRDAALVNASGVAVVSVPRYLMIGGLTALALAFFSREVEAMGANMDFELLLPLAVKNLIPVGLSGLVLAGLLSAHMSTVSSFLNLVPAFFVNDIYKKYFRPDAPDRTYVRMSYAVTAAVTVASIGFGIAVGSVDAATRWIVSALWAGSAAANVLKWHWWRFNGYGYFLGMMAGLLVALALPVFFPHLDALEAYPWILLISGTASVGGTFLAPPESDRLLMSFYTTVRPWGFWKPVLLKVRAASPEFLPNRDFGRDFLNVLVGIVWQLSLMAAPLAFVLKDWGSFAWTAAVALTTTVLLKKFWFDRLDIA